MAEIKDGTLNFEKHSIVYNTMIYFRLCFIRLIFPPNNEFLNVQLRWHLFFFLHIFSETLIHAEK